MRAQDQALPPNDAATVLTRAFLRTGERLGLQQNQLAPVLGTSPASMSRLSRSRFIQPESKEGELAVLFVRLYRGLDTLLGGDDEANQRWFHARNSHLGGVPAELVRSVEGLVRVVGYLDAMRGKL